MCERKTVTLGEHACQGTCSGAVVAATMVKARELRHHSLCNAVLRARRASAYEVRGAFEASMLQTARVERLLRPHYRMAEEHAGCEDGTAELAVDRLPSIGINIKLSVKIS